MKAGPASHLLVAVAVLISVGAFVRPWIWPTKGFAVDAAQLGHPLGGPASADALQTDTLRTDTVEPSASHRAMSTNSRSLNRSGPLPVDWLHEVGDPATAEFGGELGVGETEAGACNQAPNGACHRAPRGGCTQLPGAAEGTGADKTSADKTSGSENVAPSRERPDQGHVPPRDA